MDHNFLKLYLEILLHKKQLLCHLTFGLFKIVYTIQTNITQIERFWNITMVNTCED